jgi:hypothetical protein
MPEDSTFSDFAGDVPDLGGFREFGNRADSPLADAAPPREGGIPKNASGADRSLLDLTRAVSLWRMAHEICLSPHPSGQVVP